MAIEHNLEDLRFKAFDFNKSYFEELCKVLINMGLDLRYCFSPDGTVCLVEIKNLPTLHQAKLLRTRNAGRKLKAIQLPEDSIFSDETPFATFLEWQKSHTVKEGMKELGLTRSTYYRRMEIIREYAEEERLSNQNGNLSDVEDPWVLGDIDWLASRDI